MYEDFYGLKDRPFKLSPDPAYYFGSKQHSRARAYLEYGMQQNEGFIVVTGEVGAGKTTIIRSVLDSLDSSKILAANLVSTQVDAEDTLRLIAAAFGLKVTNTPKSELLMTIEACVLNAATQGKRCLLIVDEAQSLTSRAVEELRMLSNFQLGNRALLQSFLVGQPEFREILQSPGMQQLRQRVIASCHIGPLMDDEIQPYIAHRMKCAGWQGAPLFDASTSTAIYRSTGGIPRRINMVCDRLLLKGFLDNSKTFSAITVNEVANELAEETMGAGTTVKQPGLEPLQSVPFQPHAAPARATTAPTPRVTPISSRQPAEDERHIDDNEESPIPGNPALVATLVSAELGERFADLDKSLARIERTNAAILALLQQLLLAKPAPTRKAKGDKA